MTKRAVLCGVALWLVAARAYAAPDFDRIDAYVEHERQAARVPGAALVVVEGERVVHARGFGEAAPGRPVTPQTPFLLGSVSKSITAVAVLALVDAGKIDLDAPVRRYLPSFRVADAVDADAITVRQLLDQTSGLSTYAGRELYTREDDPKDPDPVVARVASLASVHLASRPGAAFQYSNANYTTLGALVEAVSGTPYDQFVAKNVLEPLGMRATFSDVARAEAAGLARGHRYWFGVPVAFDAPYLRGELASGFWISSAEDMGRYLALHLNDGRVGEARVVSPEAMAALHRPAVSTDAAGDSYAMGWFVWSDDGETILDHGGDTPGHHAHLVMIPGKKLGFALLFNANATLGAKERINGVRKGVTALLLGREPPSPTPPYRYWAFVALLVAFIARSAWGARAAVAQWRRWRAEGGERPARRAIALDAARGAMGLAAAGLLVLVVTRIAHGPFAIAALYQPDLAALTALAALASIAGGATRLATLALRLRGPRAH